MSAHTERREREEPTFRLSNRLSENFSGKAQRPPESGGRRDPTGSREGKFRSHSFRGCGFGTPARAISTASQSRWPPDSGGPYASPLVFCSLLS
jgi:hypothetical protein